MKIDSIWVQEADFEHSFSEVRWKSRWRGSRGSAMTWRFLRNLQKNIGNSFWNFFRVPTSMEKIFSHGARLIFHWFFFFLLFSYISPEFRRRLFPIPDRYANGNCKEILIFVTITYCNIATILQFYTTSISMGSYFWIPHKRTFIWTFSGLWKKA